MTRCITWVDTRTRPYIYVYMFIPIHSRLLLSHHSAWPVGTSPRTPESSNDEALDYCINNATNSAVSRQSPSRALTLTLTYSLSSSRSIQLARIGIDIISLLHPSGLGVCVHGFRRGCWHSFSTGPLKRLKRPHDRYVISWCSRPAVGRTEHDRRPIVIVDSRFPPVIMKSYRYRTFNHRIHSTLMSNALRLYIARYVCVFHSIRCIAQFRSYAFCR